jgi:hypothetical protein
MEVLDSEPLPLRMVAVVVEERTRGFGLRVAAEEPGAWSVSAERLRWSSILTGGLVADAQAAAVFGWLLVVGAWDVDLPENRRDFS